MNYNNQINKKTVYSKQSSLISAGKSPLVNCKLHGKAYLYIDTQKFKVLCKACIESGEKHKNLEITDEVDESSSQSQSEDELECDFHPGSKGNFYCDDCRVFLCKICFANEHRTHNSNLPCDIAMNFKQNIQSLVETISKFDPKIEESIKVINDLENKIKTIRETSSKKLSDIVSNINKLFFEKNKLFLEEYKASLDSTDEDISDVNVRLKALQARVAKFLCEVLEIKGNLGKGSANALDTCVYKQSLKKFFAEALKIFNDSKFLIGSKVEISIIKANEKIEQYKEISQKLFKKIKVFRSSVINSIQTGISSFSLRVRRFTKYSKTGIKYYKTSSLKFRTNSPVSIVGFAICGLYVDENARKAMMRNLNAASDARSNSVSLATNKGSLYDSNSNNSDKAQVLARSAVKSVKASSSRSVEDPETAEVMVPFKFTIKELKTEEAKNNSSTVNGINNNFNVNNNEELISEHFMLREIRNPIDPTIVYYLNKSINISPEKIYIITIANLNKEVYLDLWSGEVSKYFINLMAQGIKCNSSHIKFEFTPPEGIESDFNEFNSGIIADLIYSYKEK